LSAKGRRERGEGGIGNEKEIVFLVVGGHGIVITVQIKV
jgi:hypothetical protein